MTSLTTQYFLTRRSSELICEYSRRIITLLNSTWNIRSKLEGIDRDYAREGDFSIEQIRARLANKMGDKSRYQNFTMPLMMTQTEAALAYLSNVFLTGYPIFGFNADPKYEDQALQFETILAENSTRAGWVRQLILFMRDGLKYNLHGIEVDWTKLTTASLETDPGYKGGKEGKPKNTVWEGNSMKRMDLYNTIFDPRVIPSEIHTKGEFAGYIEIISKIQMKQRINQLYGTIRPDVAMKAFESGIPPASGGAAGNNYGNYYFPLINPESLLENGLTVPFNWMQWAVGRDDSSKIAYKSAYEWFTFYARILPDDFDIKVPESNTPQIWKFEIVNGTVPVCAYRLTNAHNWLPILFGQPLEDGLGFQTKSLSQNVQDLQNIGSAFWNASLASKRKLVMDRIFYDPSRIRDADINSDNPAAKVPVRPTAYGKPISESFAVVPYRDELSARLEQDAEVIVKYANLITGQNPPQQGQFVKGNKTKHEYEDVMGHSNARNQVMALLMEFQIFVPMKEIIKLNTLQYQATGSIYNSAKQKTVAIDPIQLREAEYAFKLSDGLVPSDKIMSMDAWQVAMQVIGSTPQMMAGYEMVDMITYLMKLRGADVSMFEKSKEQRNYEQALAAWQNTAAMLMDKKDVDPKEIAKILGPMPQPPLSAQQQQQQIAQAAQQPTAALSDMTATAGATR